MRKYKARCLAFGKRLIDKCQDYRWYSDGGMTQYALRASAIRFPGFKTQLSSLLAVCPGPGYLTSLCFNGLINKRKVIVG